MSSPWRSPEAARRSSASSAIATTPFCARGCSRRTSACRWSRSPAWWKARGRTGDGSFSRRPSTRIGSTRASSSSTPARWRRSAPSRSRDVRLRRCLGGRSPPLRPRVSRRRRQRRALRRPLGRPSHRAARAGRDRRQDRAERADERRRPHACLEPRRRVGVHALQRRHVARVRPRAEHAHASGALHRPAVGGRGAERARRASGWRRRTARSRSRDGPGRSSPGSTRARFSVRA